MFSHDISRFKYIFPVRRKHLSRLRLASYALLDTDHVHFPDGRLNHVAVSILAAVVSDYVDLWAACVPSYAQA